VRARLEAGVDEAAALAGAAQVVDVDPSALHAATAEVAQVSAHDHALAVGAGVALAVALDEPHAQARARQPARAAGTTSAF